MKWILGLDLRASSDGAVRFARWLAESSRSADGESAIGVHVLEEEHLRYVLRQHHLDEVTAAAREAAVNLVAAERATAVMREVKITQAVHADEGLEAVRAELGADGIVVGRAAARGDGRVVRLGRVTRRLLRNLASPVIVVPPDLRTEDLGDGPVIGLTSLRDDSTEACRFASDMAQRLGRRLLVLHVARGPEAYYLPAESGDRARADHLAAAEEALTVWVTAAGIRPDASAVLHGSPVENAVEVASRERSPLVVAGSRHLSLADRIVQASVGSSLAATATVPVAIVPPGR